MRTTQRMEYALQCVVGSPEIVNDNPRHPLWQATPLGGHPVEGQQRGRSNMQPLRFTADPEPGLVEMLDRGVGHVIAHRIDEAPEAIGTVPADPRDGGSAKMHAKQVNHQFGQDSTKAPIRLPYCTGALTQSGNAARVLAPHLPQRQSWARCSVTISGCGSGRSKTCREA